jgi:hypothetical protein
MTKVQELYHLHLYSQLHRRIYDNIERRNLKLNDEWLDCLVQGIKIGKRFFHKTRFPFSFYPFFLHISFLFFSPFWFISQSYRWYYRFTYIRSKDKRSNDKRSNDQRPKDKRSNDKRSKDKRSNWTQGRTGTQGRMTEGRMTEGRKGLKVERPNTEFERRKTEGRK